MIHFSTIPALSRRILTISKRNISNAPRISGVYPIMATPFHDDESLDLVSFERSVRFLKDSGVDGVTITGVLGESNRLLDNEREALIRTAVSSADGMPVVVGTSHAGTFATRELSQMAEELGASGVMVTPTKEPTPLTDDRMIEYFQYTADAINIPIVLQDHPASTQVNMSSQLMSKLVREIPKINCIKLEAVPTPVKIDALKKQMILDMDNNCHHDRTELPTIMCGLGALYAAFDLRSGIDGFM